MTMPYVDPTMIFWGRRELVTQFNDYFDVRMLLQVICSIGAIPQALHSSSIDDTTYEWLE